MQIESHYKDWIEGQKGNEIIRGTLVIIITQETKTPIIKNVECWTCEIIKKMILQSFSHLSPSPQT